MRLSVRSLRRWPREVWRFSSSRSSSRRRAARAAAALCAADRTPGSLARGARRHAQRLRSGRLALLIVGRFVAGARRLDHLRPSPATPCLPLLQPGPPALGADPQ